MNDYDPFDNYNYHYKIMNKFSGLNASLGEAGDCKSGLWRLISFRIETKLSIWPDPTL